MLHISNHSGSHSGNSLRAELIFSFAKRELLGRYKGSALGIAWAVLTPVVMIAIFTFIFRRHLRRHASAPTTHHWEYALYLFCGLLPWSMFQESCSNSATTIVAHSNLVKRVVFPLEALPAAQVFAALGNQLFATWLYCSRRSSFDNASN
jgi:lipopolysaccharide transport system permease protein